MLEKVIYAGSRSSSFAQAAQDIGKLAEAKISSQRIRRATEHIGNERAEQSRRSQAAYQAMYLPARQGAPAGVEAPELACVQMDGGRMQIRRRSSGGGGVIEQTEASEEHRGYWRESKVGCLLHMTSQTSSSDPTPMLPAVFTDRAHMQKMCSEIKGFSAPEHVSKEAHLTQQSSLATTDEAEHRAPLVVSRNVVASTLSSAKFGLQLATAAYHQGFNAAARKAFVCDGQAANWKVWEQWFSHYTPIVDFVHAVCYIFAASMAGRSEAEGWNLYVVWAQWLWQGDVDLIIASLISEQKRVGKPAADESTTSPRYTVARALTYLQNQRARMNYSEYRRQGLPITSSHIESTIKQINKRVKGSEKFWDRCSEAIVHLAADHIGSPEPLASFWAHRPSTIASIRCRSMAA